MIEKVEIGTWVKVSNSKHCNSRLRTGIKGEITEISRNGGFKIVTSTGKWTWLCKDCAGSIK